VDVAVFMAKFCEHRSKQVRKNRKDALLSASRRRRVAMPPEASPHKNGQAKKFFTHDLLAAWPGLMKEGFDLPALLALDGV